MKSRLAEPELISTYELKLTSEEHVRIMNNTVEELAGLISTGFDDRMVYRAINVMKGMKYLRIILPYKPLGYSALAHTLGHKLSIFEFDRIIRVYWHKDGRVFQPFPEQIIVLFLVKF